MSAKAIAKRIKFIFMLCLFSGLCGLGYNVYNSFMYHRFAGISLLALLVIAEGVILWRAFQNDSLEKALNQISTLKTIALVLAAYSVFSLAMYFGNNFVYSFNLLVFWFQIVSNLSALCFSCNLLYCKNVEGGRYQKIQFSNWPYSGVGCGTYFLCYRGGAHCVGKFGSYFDGSCDVFRSGYRGSENTWK